MHKQVFTNFLANKNLFAFVYINLSGLAVIYFLLTSSFNPQYLWITALAFIMFKGIGIEAGNHRLLSHRSYKTSRPIKIILLLIAALSGSGSPIVWAGLHRVNHHKNADKDNDIHSPVHGFWHSYVLWMFKTNKKDVNLKSIVDLLRDKDVVFFHRYSTNIFWITNLILFFLDPQLLVFGLILPAFITFHSYCLQTSILHIPKFGYKNFDTKDHSINCPWIFPLAWGEAWHNNHHAHPGKLSLQEKWWEIDPAYWFITLVKE